jgi:hypothetical protein
MDSTIASSLVGAATALVVAGAGFYAGGRSQKATSRDTAVDESRAAVQELVTAVFDLKMALSTWETRWRDTHGWAPAWLYSVAQLIAGVVDEKPVQGGLNGLASAMTFRRESEMAEQAIINGPMARVAAASARIAMLENRALREASHGVTDAISDFVLSYKSRRNQAARQRAEEALDDAIGAIGIAARAYTGRERKLRLRRGRRRVTMGAPVRPLPPSSAD